MQFYTRTEIIQTVEYYYANWFKKIAKRASEVNERELQFGNDNCHEYAYQSVKQRSNLIFMQNTKGNAIHFGDFEFSYTCYTGSGSSEPTCQSTKFVQTKTKQ